MKRVRRIPRVKPGTPKPDTPNSSVAKHLREFNKSTTQRDRKKAEKRGDSKYPHTNLD